MEHVKFNMDTAIKIKLHYQAQYTQTLNKLQELKQILDQFEQVDTGALQLDLNTSVLSNDVSNSLNNETTAVSSNNHSQTTKRKYKKRKGSKNPWVNFIKSRLKATQLPLSYDDITNHAIAIKNLDPKDFKDIRKKMVGASYVLRTKKGIIDTYAIKGSRTKYMGLKEWFERDGLLKVEFAAKINQ
jgi:hypothetical protein